MVMFEQDFLCAISGSTTLMNTDLESGRAWLQAMDSAASIGLGRIVALHHHRSST
jgi:hypothetical protein